LKGTVRPWSFPFFCFLVHEVNGFVSPHTLTIASNTLTRHPKCLILNWNLQKRELNKPYLLKVDYLCQAFCNSDRKLTNISKYSRGNRLINFPSPVGPSLPVDSGYGIPSPLLQFDGRESIPLLVTHW
jgi:hypothetical protein